MRVAVVGGGVAGLVTARTLLPLGVDIVVYESRPDLGGVWSRTRGYPGLRIQNDKRTYAFSDLPFPDDVPRNPDREQVHAYLSAYARRHGLDAVLRLGTTVERAEYDPDQQRWSIVATGPDGLVEDTADWLVVANGTLSEPAVPELDGAAEFERAGGRIALPSDLRDPAELAGRRVVVLGYGKSATDIAMAALAEGSEVTVLARSVPWKLPERIGPVPFQAVVNSRAGEHLLWGPFRTPVGRVLRRLDTPLRWAFRSLVARAVRRQLGLDRRGLVPPTSILNVSHLVTQGFDEAVDDHRIDLRIGTAIERLSGDDGSSAVRTTEGATIAADLLVLATGYRTDLSFLDERTRGLLLDERGRMPLHRHTLPLRAPRLLFAGWTNSFRSTIAAELQAVWIAALLHGLVELPGLPEPGSRGAARLGAPAGLTIVDQDAWLHDVGLPVPRSVRAAELLGPLDPAAYAGVQDRLRRRLEARQAEAAPPIDPPATRLVRGAAPTP